MAGGPGRRSSRPDGRLDAGGRFGVGAAVDVGLRDGASFYPALFQMLRLAPRHLDRDVFLKVYDDLRCERLEAKRNGDKVVSDGLKVAINAVYGKQSEAYSKLLDPQNGAAIGINGQLVLLRLIEALLPIEGLSVLSANTDGIMVRFPRQHEARLRATVNRDRQAL